MAKLKSRLAGVKIKTETLVPTFSTSEHANQLKVSVRVSVNSKINIYNKSTKGKCKSIQIVIQIVIPQLLADEATARALLRRSGKL